MNNKLETLTDEKPGCSAEKQSADRLPGTPIMDILCACRDEDPFGVLALLANTPWRPLDWCWGHGLLQPSWVRRPYLYLAGPLAETMAIAAHLEQTNAADISLTGYGWQLRPVLAENQLRWKLSASRLEIEPVWRPKTLAAEWARIGRLFATWTHGQGTTGSTRLQQMPPCPQQDQQQKRQNNQLNDQNGATFRAVIRTLNEPAAEYALAPSASPCPHEPATVADTEQRVKHEMQRWRRHAGHWSPPWRWRIARWLHQLARIIGRYEVVDIVATEPWWTAPIDPAIRPLVAALQQAGLQTLGSCSGHSWWHDTPYLAFAASPEQAQAIQARLDSAAAAMPPLLTYSWSVSGYVSSEAQLIWYIYSPQLMRRPVWNKRAVERDLFTLAIVLSPLQDGLP